MSAGPPKFSYRALLRESFGLPLVAPIPAALTFSFIALSWIAVDLGWIDDGWTIPVSLVSLGLEYWFLRSMLSAIGALQNGSARFPAFIGASLLTGLAVLAGMMLLLLPGLILLVRWSAVLPLVVSEDTGVVDAMKRSWWGTSRSFWPILSLLLTIYLPWVLGSAYYFAAVSLPGFGNTELYPFLTVAFDLATAASVIVGWAASAAIYLAPFRADALEEIFS